MGSRSNGGLKGLHSIADELPVNLLHHDWSSTPKESEEQVAVCFERQLLKESMEWLELRLGECFQPPLGPRSSRINDQFPYGARGRLACLSQSQPEGGP
jgi:hypothetical protein